MRDASKNPLSRYARWLHTQWPAGRVEPLPVVRDDGSTDVPGLYVAGDLAGIPLLKFSADTGAKVVQRIAEDPAFIAARRARAAGVHDLIIVGAGVSGMAAALEAKRWNLDCQVVEAAQAFSTVVNFPRGKPIYTYPKDMVPAGPLQVHADVKEGLLAELTEQARDVPVRLGRVESIARSGGVFTCTLAQGEAGGEIDRQTEGQAAGQTTGTLRALRVLVAIGRSGDFRKLGVPGEELDKVYNRLHDPRDYAGQRALVVGGGDSAVETAIALAESGAEVTLSYRQERLSRPKPDNLARIAALAGPPGHLNLALSSEVQEILPGEVILRDAGGQGRRLANDVVFVMIGREAPLSFLRRAGVRIHGEWRAGRVVACALFMLFCVALYNWKSGGSLSHFTASRDLFPHSLAHKTNDYVGGAAGSTAPSLHKPWQFLHPLPARPPSAAGTTGTMGAVARTPCGVFPGCADDRTSLWGTVVLSASGPSFWYTLAYSLLIIVFGVRRVLRRKTPYVKWQTAALAAIQLVPLFLLPEIILPLLGYHGLLPRTLADSLFPAVDYGHGREYWRAYGLILAWPLFVYNLFTDAPLWGWLAISLIQTFVLLPALIYFYGKGVYCGWICSCGALAETLGDDHRQKMVHGPGWNRVNLAGQGILLVALCLLLLRVVGWAVPSLGVNRFFSVLVSGSYNDSDSFVTKWFNYKWVVDVFLSGVIGYGLYFWYSGRVWCRFFCPLAALMHIYARFSRFRIFADKKKCISCNVCTSVCHMGIDVMGFANKGLPMKDPECVRCSACVSSCPTGVLTFGQADPSGGVRSYDRLPASLVQLRENPAARRR